MPSARTPDPSSVPSAPGSATRRRPPGRPLGRPLPSRPLHGRLPPPLRCRPFRRPLPRPFRRPPSAGSGSSRFPAPGRPMTARCTGPRARRRARYPSPVRAPTRTRSHREAPSRPVLLSQSARASPPRGTGGPRGRVVQAVRPGDRGNPGRRPVTETTHSLDDRTSPGADQPAHPDPRPRSEAQDPAHHDVAAGGAGGGDDRRAQLRAAVPRAGPAPGAPARPPSRSRAARPPGAMALHRNRGRLERPF